MYDIHHSFCTDFGQRRDGNRTISINGSEFMMKMPYADSWTDFSFGIHASKKGTNKIQLLPK